jgi:hypothetical protein
MEEAISVVKWKGTKYYSKRLKRNDSRVENLKWNK